MNKTTPVSSKPLEDLDQLDDFLEGRYQEGKPKTEFGNMTPRQTPAWPTSTA